MHDFVFQNVHQREEILQIILCKEKVSALYSASYTKASD